MRSIFTFPSGTTPVGTTFSTTGIAISLISRYYGAKGARGNQKLTIAAAGHGGLQGDIEYPQQKGLRGPDDEMRWWDYWLKGIDTGIMAEPPVTYFMMASGRKGHPSDLSRAIKAANWPPASRETRYYLAPHISSRVTTKAPVIAEAKQSYRDDPANPVKSVGGANLTQAAGPMDQRAIESVPTISASSRPYSPRASPSRATSAWSCTRLPTAPIRISWLSWWTFIRTDTRRSCWTRRSGPGIARGGCRTM